MGVGLVVLNAQRQIWIGRRCDELITEEAVYRWQMPQGGIDADENPKDAALRELWEETGIRSVEILAETGWIHYDLPAAAVGRALKGKYRGQRQKWFAALFTGEESEINLMPPEGDPEFDEWRWASAPEVIELIVPFKRSSYEQALSALAPACGFPLR
jgi:putative (di)nucleoside polyphosphate hydrolase